MTIRVAVADDQPLVRTGFATIVAHTNDLELVGEAGNGDEAVALARSQRPDVVLMDVRMPIVDGIEATRRITADPACAGVRVVILTTFDLDEYVYGALRAGASGFLLKDAAPEEVLSAVRVVARGEALLAPSVTRRLIERFADLPAERRTDARGVGDGSPSGNGKSWAWWRRACPTPRSPPASSSARPRPRRTSAGCSPSSASTTGPSSSCSPTRPAW